MIKAIMKEWGDSLKRYSSLFVCKGVEYKTFVNGDMYDDDELTFEINGVKICVEFDGSLYIENFADYSNERLSFLTFYQKNDAAFLTNYVFACFIPVSVVKKETGEMSKSFLTIVNRHKGAQDNAATHLLQLLNEKSEMEYIDDAVNELQNKLSGRYSICICGCCKYGQENPYGGDAYLNYLCFRKNKAKYLQFQSGVGKLDWEFFTDEKNVEKTRPVYGCEEFLSVVG